MDTVRRVFGILLVAGLPPALIWWFLVHPFVGFWRRLGARTSLTILTFLGVSGAVLSFLHRDRLLGPDLGTHWPVILLGAVLFVVASIMARARQRHLTFRILAGVPELARDPEDRGTLLTEGPYARIRHPRYVEVVIGGFAYALLANYLGAYVLVLLMLPVLHAVVLLEERELRDRFGPAYEAYQRAVPRYLPRRGRTGGSDAAVRPAGSDP